jgi:serine protease Do
MFRSRITTRLAFAGVALFAFVASLPGQASVTKTANELNKKMVKLFGAGGFKGLPSYGTGILVSPKGYILTVNNHILSTADLRCHLYDGRFYHCKILFKEPELDVALVKIDGDVDNLPFFDVEKAAARPLSGPGDWVIGMGNCFQVATKDEPMTVQRGVIAAYAELRGRKGVFEAPFQGGVYFVDAIVCNPGAAGGVITNLKGDLLGLIGRELKNSLSDTWINYAVPIQAKVDIQRGDKTEKVDIATFVKQAMEGKYIVGTKVDRAERAGYHGIILVHNAVQVTPPFVEEVASNSPAAKAGLRPDDLIVYVDGELVSSIRNFRDIMKHVGPGSEVKLDVQRGTKLKTFKLKLDEQPKGK